MPIQRSQAKNDIYLGTNSASANRFDSLSMTYAKNARQLPFSRRRRCERREHPWCARHGPWIGGASPLRSKSEATASRRQLHAGGGVARQSGLAPRGRVGKKPEARCSTERK